MADRLHNVQSPGPVCQEPQGPSGMPCGGLTASERDQSCFGLAIQARRAGGALLFLPVECGLQPLFDPTLSDAKHGIDAHGEALGDLGIRPGRPIRIGFQQDMGVSDLVCGRSPFSDQLCQLDAVLVGKTYDVLFVHGGGGRWKMDNLAGKK
jgi:hypothetical protein